jgi:hypothetical protein
MTIGLFEAIKTTNQTLATNPTKLLDQYRLKKQIIAYVKDEGSNLITMTTTLKLVVKHEVLGLNESFQGAYFCYVFLRHVSMLQLIKRFVKTLDLFLSRLPSQICKIL